jgi:hypothetical protein
MAGHQHYKQSARIEGAQDRYAHIPLFIQEAGCKLRYLFIVAESGLNACTNRIPGRVDRIEQAGTYYKQYKAERPEVTGTQGFPGWASV